MALQKVNRYHAISALVLGIIELLFAAGIAICSFILAGLFNAAVLITPYWAGLPYLIPGILGMVVGFTKNHCAMVSFMIINIICFIINIVACAALLIIGYIWITFANQIKNNDSCYYSSNSMTCHCPADYDHSSKTITGVKNCEALTGISNVIIIIIGLACVNCLVSLVSSIIGCSWVCCSSRQVQQPGAIIVQAPPGTVMQPPGYGFPPQQTHAHQPIGSAPPAYPMQEKNINQL